MYAASLPASETGCGAVPLAAGAAGPLQAASVAASVAATSVREWLVIRFILTTEVLLRDHHVDAHVAVHELRDVRVRGH